MEKERSKKRDEKKARKLAEQEEKQEEIVEEIKSEDDALDYSSNEEDQLEKSQSLQRVEPHIPRTFEERQNMPRLIVVLEFA